MIETKLRYSEPLLREAVRFYFVRAVVRQLGATFFLILIALAIGLALLIARHDEGWLVGFLIALFVFVGAFLAAVYVAHYRNTIGRFRQMRTPEATLECDENVITITSELGSGTMPWSAIKEIWRHPRFWLLMFSQAQFVTLPLDGLDEQTRAFITRKVEEANALPTDS